jgi:ABC-type thiamin/hydroxymethylpyrimidine transport system permease subunit
LVAPGERRIRMRDKRYYFTTRDLLMMAALAALGGITSTYLNAIGNVVRSVVGFAGTTQWAAGLHVLWLTLAMGLVGKTGTGTLTGILKGVVELLSGNTHGLLVLLIDVVAGVLVDVGFAPFRRKDRLAAYLIAGGLASASNVLVFQLYAALPADILAYGAIALVSGIAALSGVVFAGLLSWSLLNTLRRAGVVKDSAPVVAGSRVRMIALAAGLTLTVALGGYLRFALRGPATFELTGAVGTPYRYPAMHGDVEPVTREVVQQGTTTRYTGIPLRTLVERSQPNDAAAMLLIEAADGYAFFITMEELVHNEGLLIVAQGKGEDTAYSLVGPESSKAWVRNVTQITVVGGTTLEIQGALQLPGTFRPAEWQAAMDSTAVALAGGGRKLQGTPLAKVLAAMEPEATATVVIVHTETESVALSLDEVMNDPDVRIFIVFDPPDVGYVVARMNGLVLAEDVRSIEVQ